jgi:hypothetical protein
MVTVVEGEMRSDTSYRRTRRVAVGAFGVIAITFFATMPSAQSAAAAGVVKPGRGLALAEIEKIDPRAGSLSLGITSGRSIAGHQNTVAQASSQAYDYGVIGGTLAAKGCSGGAPTLPDSQQPHPIQVDSRDANSTKDATEPNVPVPGQMHASAHPTPFAEAITTMAPQDLKVMQIGGGVATTHSGLLDDGTTREAKATTDIDSITFVGGITLSSMHWEAAWRSTDPANGVVGIFTIGKASIAGQSLPTNDPTQVLLQLNGALAPFGFAITPPQARKAGDVIFVDTMGIRVFPSTQRDAVARGLLGGAQPVRQQTFDELLAQSCSFASGITVLDILVGSMTGGGSFSLVLGGVQASSGDAYDNAYCLGCNTPKPSLNTNVLAATNAVSAPSGGGTTFKGNTAPGPTTAATTGTVTPVTPVKFNGKRGGALATVGLAGLGMIAAMAEGDRRKMRRAQREIPRFEE